MPLIGAAPTTSRGATIIDARETVRALSADLARGAGPELAGGPLPQRARRGDGRGLRAGGGARAACGGRRSRAACSRTGCWSSAPTAAAARVGPRGADPAAPAAQRRRDLLRPGGDRRRACAEGELMGLRVPVRAGRGPRRLDHRPLRRRSAAASPSGSRSCSACATPRIPTTWSPSPRWSPPRRRLAGGGPARRLLGPGPCRDPARDRAAADRAQVGAPGLARDAAPRRPSGW